MGEMKQEQTGTAQVPSQARSVEETTATHRATAPSAPERMPESTGYGWMLFASMMVLMAGVYHAMVGLVALFNSGFYLVGPNDLLVQVDFTAYGWTHLVIGALAIATAIGLMVGQSWARAVGVALALVSAVISLAFLPAFPILSTIVIALDVLVIYAITVHGKEVTA